MTSYSDEKAEIRDFWGEFARTRKDNPASRFYETFHFDDNESSANALAALVLAGRKRATASLFWAYEADGKRLPKAGDLSVMTTWDGAPQCVLETTQIDVVPYEAVTEEFAATEGEGDGSLRYWKDAHWRYFSRECRRIGREPHPQMLVVCERFQVVYR